MCYVQKVCKKVRICRTHLNWLEQEYYTFALVLIKEVRLVSGIQQTDNVISIFSPRRKSKKPTSEKQGEN